MRWEILVCPCDQSPLDDAPGCLVCRECGRAYPLLDGVPRFVCRADDTRLCSAEPQGRPALRLRAAGRRPESAAWERLVGRFARYQSNSRLLQLGSRSGMLESFGLGERYGVDPRAAGALAPTSPLHWIAACPHDLPFRGETFDAVLIAPSRAPAAPQRARLVEAARCLAADGVLCVAVEPALDAGRKLVELAGLCGLHFVWSCAAGPASSAYLFRRWPRYSASRSGDILDTKLRLVA